MTDPALWLDEHGDYLYRFALRYGVGREVAEDLVQETLLAGIQSLPNFRGGSSIRTWLGSILKHRLMDLFRKSARDSHPGPTEEVDLDTYFRSDGHWHAHQAEVNPERHCQFRDLMKVVLACLEQLNERSRRVFLLTEFDGLEPSELSEPLALTPENVRVILHRARLKLRGCVLKGGIQL